MNDANREALAAAVFVVENEAEHKRGGDYPPVESMRAIRNRLYDDLGWNESRAVRLGSMPTDTLLKRKPKPIQTSTKEYANG
jgi:hypothetical protein